MKKEDNKIAIRLSKEEALVFLDWLTRFNNSEQIFEDQAEERVLFDCRYPKN